MSKFIVTANEEIPANRLVVLTINGKENDDEIRVRLASNGEPPDFVSGRLIQEGEKVTVTITNKTSWKVEADEDIRAGVSVGVTNEGKLVEALREEDFPSIGYSIHSGVAGEIVEYIRNVKYASGNNSIADVSTFSTQSFESEEFPKHSGGAYYELSNGDKVKGKREAEKAEKSLQE